MDIRLFGLALLSATAGIIGSIASIILLLTGNDPTVANGGLWTYVMIIGVFVGELAVYLSWKIKSKSTSFWGILDRLSIFMIVYAAILFSVDNLLYIIALAVVIYVWRELYTEVGGISGDENSQRLTLSIMIRFLIRPSMRVIYAVIGLFGGTTLLENQLTNLLTSFTILAMAIYTWRLKDELL